MSNLFELSNQGKESCIEKNQTNIKWIGFSRFSTISFEQRTLKSSLWNLSNLRKFNKENLDITEQFVRKIFPEDIWLHITTITSGFSR